MIVEGGGGMGGMIDIKIFEFSLLWVSNDYIN